MENELLNYIDACKINIANYMLIDDEDDRERALTAGYDMMECFEKLLKEEMRGEL